MTHSSLWKLPELLDEFLVDQLLQNRLAIVLGAGVSHGAKLPNWETLVYRLYKQEEEAPPEGRTPEEASEDFLLKHCGNDEHELAKRVHVALYENADLTSPALASDKMLNALGAIMTSSGRGSAAYAVSFNYDDLLECHLRYRGFVVDSVHSLPNWSNSADMIIYHAHGYLPSNPGEGISKGIVLTAQSYDNVIGNESSYGNKRSAISLDRIHVFLLGYQARIFDCEAP